MAANSKNAVLAVTSGNGVVFQNRSSTGGKTSSTSISGIVAPHWVKLIRAGNTITGYRSVDRVTWSKVGSTALSMSASPSRATPTARSPRPGSATSIAGAVAVSAAACRECGPNAARSADSQHSPFSAVPILPDAASVEDSDEADDWDAPLLELLV